MSPVAFGWLPYSDASNFTIEGRCDYLSIGANVLERHFVNEFL